MSNLSRRRMLQQSAGFALSASAFPGLSIAADAPAKKSPAKPKVDPYADAKFLGGAPPAAARDSFTVVVLPDTQKYSESYPEQYYAQTEWIVDQAKDRNIAAVFHLGDITNRSTRPEWEVASKAMAKLDGVAPYFMICGNHDYSDGGKCVDRSTLYNEFFPRERFQRRSNFGGTYDREPERMENSFQTFEVAGRKFLVLSLEFGPRRDVVRWANEVAVRHADHEAILLTHAYMYYDETRYDWQSKGKEQTWNPHSYGVAKATSDDISDGEELWTSLVSKHENFILTLNGHVLNDGLGRMTSKTPQGRDVHQCLVNFQMKPNGGDGWLRLLEFKTDGRTVDVVDYSPTLDRQNVSRQNKFTMKTAAIG